MRAAACICGLAFCLSLLGCSTLGKKFQKKPNQPPAEANAPAPPAPLGGNAPLTADRTVPAKFGGILAGRVLDSYDHLPPPTYIQVQLAQDGRGNKSAPVEVATDNQGFFTIHDLQPGQHYQLIARTRDGSPRLAGTTWATPPNPRVLIYMSEDFATPNTPAAPPPPVVPGQNGKRQPAEAGRSDPGAWNNPERSPSGDQGNGNGSNTEQAKAPSSNLPTQPPADISAPPLKTKDANQESSQPRAEVRPQDTVQRDEAMLPPITSVPSQVIPERQSSPASVQPYSQTIPSVATRVPSCVLTGRQLDNFALNDLFGQPWEYRNNRSRLALLDFWGTWCMPCRQAIPHLNILQNNYGRYGLKVVGIAYEYGTLQERLRKVQDVRNHLGINYQLLLGSDFETCPVKTQFAIGNFPTMVLLDENSRIIWRCEGFDAGRLQELEMLIKLQLHLR